VKATGRDREVRVSGTSLDSHGPGGGSYVEILAGDTVKSSVPVNSRGGDTYNEAIDAAANGSNAQVKVRLCYTKSSGGEQCGPYSAVNGDAVPFGDLATPGISAWLDGQTVRFRASGSGNGAGARMVVTSSNGNRTYTSGVNAGGFTFEDGLPLPAGEGTSFTAHLESVATDPSRRNSGQASSARVDVPNPTVSVYRGDVFDSANPPSGWKGSCTSSRCHWVRVNLSGFSSSQTCSIIYTDQGTGGFVSWTQGNGEFQTQNVFGGYVIRVKCGNVTGENSNW